MIEKPKTFRDLIDQLGGFVAVGTALHLPVNTVKGMRLRNSVAVDHWPKLIRLSREKGFLFTSDDFVGMAQNRQVEKRRQDEAAA